MKLADNMRRKCIENNIDMDLPCPLSREYNRPNRYATIDADGVEVLFYTENLWDDQQHETEHQAQFSEMLTDLLMQNMDAQDAVVVNALQDDEVDAFNSDSDSDDDFDVGQKEVLREYSRFVTVAECTSNTTGSNQSVQHAQPFRFEGCKWKPIKLLLNGAKWLFGRFVLRLTCFVRRKVAGGGTQDIRFRLDWHYASLHQIAVTKKDSIICIGMKTTDRPKMFRYLGANQWQPVPQTPEEFKFLDQNGKFGLFMREPPVLWKEVNLMWRKYHRFTADHRCGWAHYRSICVKYDEEERKAAQQAFRSTRAPLICEHSKLAAKIDKVMHHQRKGHYKLSCLSCGQEFDWFKRHCMCLEDDEAVKNVTSNLFERLQFDGEVEPRMDVRITTDPLRSTETDDPQSVIEKHPKFWGRFIFNVYQRFVHNQVIHNTDVVYNLRVDEDWEKLNMDVGSWLVMLNEVMRRTLEEVEYHMQSDFDKDVFLKDMFTSLSVMFILPNKFESLIEDESPSPQFTQQQRAEMFEDATFCVRLATHYIPKNVCATSEMIAIFVEFATEITHDDGLWCFWSSMV